MNWANLAFMTMNYASISKCLLVTYTHRMYIVRPHIHTLFDMYKKMYVCVRLTCIHTSIERMRVNGLWMFDDALHDWSCSPKIIIKTAVLTTSNSIQSELSSAHKTSCDKSEAGKKKHTHTQQRKKQRQTISNDIEKRKKNCTGLRDEMLKELKSNELTILRQQFEWHGRHTAILCSHICEKKLFKKMSSQTGKKSNRASKESEGK